MLSLTIKNWFKQNWKSVCCGLSAIFLWILVKENILDLSPAWGYLIFGAVKFDGTDDFIDVGASDTLNLTGSFTISAWINPGGAASGDSKIIYERGTIGGTQGYSLSLNTNGGLRVVFIGVLAYNSNPGVIAATGWQHVAGVHDDSANTIDFYVDGVSVGQVSVGSLVASPGVVSLIGRAKDAGLSRYFDGQITELSIYNTAFIAPEIAQLYNSGVKYMPNQMQQANRVEYWPMDDGPDGTGADGDTVRGVWNGNDGTGSDGANNTGLTWKAEEVLSYPADPIFISPILIAAGIPIFDHHYRQMRA